jgi:hypothetical protein
MTRRYAHTPEAVAKREQRESDGWWIVLDARGKVIQAVRTNGCHPGLTRGGASNVMRTFAVPGRPDLATQIFDKGARRMVDDPAKVEARAVQAREADLAAMSRAEMLDSEILPAMRAMIEPLAAKIEELERRLNNE